MTDRRHLTRIKLIQNLFALEFNKDSNNLNLCYFSHFPQEKLKKILNKKDEIDSLIKKYAPRYPLQEIAKVDLAILRWAIYEIFFEEKLPYKVVIDEAVELAKELSSENSYSFINGVLGSLIKNYHHESKNKS